jgi:hypothetical protein
MAVLSASPRLRAVLLWTLALVVMLASVAYQRRTGPTYPKRGEVVVAGEPVRYQLVRSASTSGDARVALPAEVSRAGGALHYKRFRTADALTVSPLVREQHGGRDEWAAFLPKQPAAGKLEYFVMLEREAGSERVPSDLEPVVIRFKDDVPTPLLAAHVVMMFVSLVVGMRAGLAALLGVPGTRRLACVAFAGITVGGMVLGPFVQKYAFGAYWTGFPWGYDLTDNKTLLMWLAWLGACAVLWRTPAESSARARSAVLAATLAMTVVYVIPHSLFGSELDYDAVDRGVPASEAIGTGR